MAFPLHMNNTGSSVAIGRNSSTAANAFECVYPAYFTYIENMRVGRSSSLGELGKGCAAGGYADIPVTFDTPFPSDVAVGDIYILCAHNNFDKSTVSATIASVNIAIVGGTVTRNGFTARVFNDNTSGSHGGRIFYMAFSVKAL